MNSESWWKAIVSKLTDLLSHTERELGLASIINQQREMLFAAQIPWLLSFRVADDHNLINYAISDWRLYKEERETDEQKIKAIAEEFYHNLRDQIGASVNHRAARSLTFNMVKRHLGETEKSLSVVNDFKKWYSIHLEWPNLSPVEFTDKKRNLYPMKWSLMEKGRKYPSKLDEEQKASMTKFARPRRAKPKQSAAIPHKCVHEHQSKDG